MHNNNLDTLDASDQMLSPQIKLPNVVASNKTTIVICKKKITHP